MGFLTRPRPEDRANFAITFTVAFFFKSVVITCYVLASRMVARHSICNPIFSCCCASTKTSPLGDFLPLQEKVRQKRGLLDFVGLQRYCLSRVVNRDPKPSFRNSSFIV